jgi:hypothetical protein
VILHPRLELCRVSFPPSVLFVTSYSIPDGRFDYSITIPLPYSIVVDLKRGDVNKNYSQ